MFYKRLLSVILSSVIFTAIFPAVTFAEDTEIYMDKRSAGYSEEKGLFFDDVKNKDPMGKTTRYCFSAGGTMSYRPEIKESGNYIVYYWNTGNSSDNDQEEITVTSDGDEAKIVLNLKGDMGWKYLGVYKFSQGGAGKISFTRDIKGGCLRSGAMKFVKTDKETAVAHSQAKKKILRDIPPGEGILITNSYKSEDYKYEEANGGFGDVAIGNCTGRSLRYTYSAGAQMKYRPALKQAGEYYVLYWVTHNSDRTNNAMRTNIYYKKGTASLVIDCTKQTGWVNLGKYEFAAGTDGYLETVNGRKKEMLMSGGAYFVSADDTNFDPSVYATIDSPGMKTGAQPDEKGDYLISTNTAGYSEAGRKDLFKTAGDFLDANGDYSRYTQGTDEALCTLMNYTADIKDQGEYEVQYFVMPDEKNAPNQKIIINTSNKAKEAIVDCTKENGWVTVGTFRFSGKAIITTPAMGAAGITRSGGIRLIKK